MSDERVARAAQVDAIRASLCDEEHHVVTPGEAEFLRQVLRVVARVVRGGSKMRADECPRP